MTRRIDLTFLAAAIVLAAHLTPYEVLGCGAMPDWGNRSGAALAAGTASAPHQYRALVPWIAAGAVKLHLISGAPDVTATLSGLNILFLVLAAFAFRRYLCLFIPDRALASVAALSLFFVIPFNFLGGDFYPYDPAALFFFTLCLTLLHQRRWPWFFLVFVLASTNDETAIFLTIVAAATLFDQYKPRVLALLLGSQVAMWLAITTALRYIYRGNPWLGYGHYDWPVIVNARTIVQFPVRGALTMLTWAALCAAAIVWRRRVSDVFLKRTLATVPLFVAAMLFHGFIVESRIFVEVFPIVIAAGAVVALAAIDRVRATRVNPAFYTAAITLSLAMLPYRIVACFPELATGGDNSPRTLATGLGTTPYQYRAMVPWIVRGLVEMNLIPAREETLAFVVIELIALVLLAVVLRTFLSLFINDRRLASAAALSAYFILPFNDLRGQLFLPYDTPSIALFALGLVLIYKRKWLWFFPVFALATLNRETSIFLAAATALALFDEIPWARLALLVGGQAAIWIAIKTALWRIYRTNPSVGSSGLFFFQLKVNAATVLSRPMASLIILSTWGCLWIGVIAWHSRIRDPFLRRMLLVVPLFLGGMALVGFAVEMRIYGEMLPIVLAAFWVGCFSLALEQRVRTFSVP